VRIVQAYFTKHPCYNAKRKSISPAGIFVHSTGAVNRELRRYVDAEAELGRNQYNNHWNKSNATKSVHAFIGYDVYGDVIVAETLPYDIACWGAGSGKNGSYNYNPHAYLQFEICQGSNDDEEYYWEAITVAEEYCAYLCKMYGWTADCITSHAEAHKAGYASNHGDPVSWMKHFGDDMNKFRARVNARINGTESPTTAPVTKPKEDIAQKPATPEKAENKAESVVYDMKTLRINSKGTQVKVLQWLLNHTTDFTCGTIDGHFGTKTLTAVRQYQEANGLTVDGVVGKNTWTKLLA
jgi:hypothetical protein